MSRLVLAPLGAFLCRDYLSEPLLTIPGRFQALFTPLLGVLFSFRSPYYCAIGLGTYLALGLMTPSFPREFQPTVLRIPHLVTVELTPTGLSPSTAGRSRPLRLRSTALGGSYNTTSIRSYPRMFGLGCAAFGRPYSRHRVCFLFLRVHRCFLSPRSRSLMGASPKGQDIPFGNPGF